MYKLLSIAILLFASSCQSEKPADAKYYPQIYTYLEKDYPGSTFNITSVSKPDSVYYPEGQFINMLVVISSAYVAVQQLIDSARSIPYPTQKQLLFNQSNLLFHETRNSIHTLYHTLYDRLTEPKPGQFNNSEACKACYTLNGESHCYYFIFQNNELASSSKWCITFADNITSEFDRYLKLDSLIHLEKRAAE